MQNHKTILMGCAVVAMLGACKTPYQPVKTFYETESPIAMTAPQKSQWAALVPGLKARWADAGLHHSSLDVPQTAGNTTCQLVGWKGERTSAEILIWAPDSVSGVKGRVSDFRSSYAKLPASIAQLNFVRYTLSDSARAAGGATALMPDMIDSLKVFDVAPGRVRPLWLSINIPSDAKPGLYKATVSVTSNNGADITLPLTLEVQNRTLAAPHDWNYHLDLWQHPTAVARTQGLKVWSDEHFAALKPIMTRLAQAGQKVVTATLNKDPWNHQCYDGYEAMIKWTKNSDGTWSYDYSVFDRWVEMMLGLGIDRMINCYSMVPWNCELEYLDQATGAVVTVSAVPGSQIFEEIWPPFLTDFKSHLAQKGWLGITNIAMDEREPEAMDAAVKILEKYAPEMGFALADNHSSYKKYTMMRDVCIAQGQAIDHDDIVSRRAKDFTTTFYVCCGPAFPNTFTSSEPFEAELLGWYGLAWDFDGMLRWAYNSWPANPQADARYGIWTSGDTYIVYPNNRSSLRFEHLRDGIEAAEKVRQLRAEGVDVSEIEAVLEEIRTTDINDPSRPWREIVGRAREALNRASRK